MTRGLWDRETLAALLLIASLPVVVTWALSDGLSSLAGHLLRLSFFLVLSGTWHLVFMLARAQPPSLAGALCAVTLAILMPPELGLTGTILATSFGVVAAELAFGGWGRNLLHPATVTLAFAGFGYPAAAWPDLPVQLAWASWAMMALAVGLGALTPAMLVAAGLALAAGAWAGIALTPALPALSLGLVLLAADPVASATTRLGRWLNGALYGGLGVLALCLWQGAHPVQITVSAALLASLAAPLCDEIAVALWLQRRKGRHG